MYTADCLRGLTHGFLSRRGGHSQGHFDSLNFALTKGDDSDSVRRNRAIALKRLGRTDASLAIAHQVHSADVTVVTRPWKFGIEHAPKTDALVTIQPDILLGVLTADCVPILLADRAAGVIATIHGGWRGLSQGIVANTLKCMADHGAVPANIDAAIGPCIHQSSYEVGEDVYAVFHQKGTEIFPFFSAGKITGKFWLDLPALAGHFLQRAGVHTIEQIPLNTYTCEERFFSCRRATHRQEPSFGCQLSAISL